MGNCRRPRRSFPKLGKSGNGGGGYPAPSGIIYKRGLGVDWMMQDNSFAAGDEADQFNAGLLTYNTNAQLPQDLVSFPTLRINNVNGNLNRFEYQSSNAIAVDHVSGKAWATTHAIQLGTVSFADAQAEIASMNAGSYMGRNNWRTPTIREILGVAQFTTNTVDAFAHFNLNSGGYWTATNAIGQEATQNLMFNSSTGLVTRAARTTPAYLLMVCNDLP